MCCRKRVEQRLQGVYAFLKHAVLRLLLLPVGKFRFAGVQPVGFIALFGNAKREREKSMFQRLARCGALLLILAFLRFLLVQLVLQGQTLAELIKLARVVFLLVHPWRDILLNIQSDIQRRARLQPRFSERLLFLRQGLRFVCLTLDLLSQGINLSQYQQTFLFKRGDLFFERITATLVIRQLKRPVGLHGRMLVGAAQRAGFACLKL